MHSRAQRAKLNIFVSFGCQLITIFCGFIAPKLIIGAFGSEAYGASASITQFLAYITLIEGGISGVAKAALYKPLANRDMEAVSAVIAEVKRFFNVIAYIFAGYVLILAFSFKSISKVESLDWISTFLLVVVISISTFGQYFIGISNSILLEAAQKAYISKLISIFATVVNTLSIIILIALGCNLIVVKLVSSLIFFMRPVALWLYVKRYYKLANIGKTKEKYLTQKWNGLSQHIAYVLHSNTDVAVLTCLADLTTVAVYSVHNMVISHITNLVNSFTSGMEALFGDMLAREEHEALHKTFGYYETLISTITVFLFSVTAVLIVPFVKLYTAGVSDADYYAPVFAFLMIFASVLFCMRRPYHSVIVAAGHYKQTQMAAYGEAILNVVLSVVLVWRLGLIGVAIGTFVATAYRFIYYVIYLSQNILRRKIKFFLKRLCVNITEFACIFLIGITIISNIQITDYALWALCGIGIALIAGVITLSITALAYRSDFSELLGRYVRRHK